MDTPEKRKPTGTYSVGFAAPPAEYRFCKGKSGNPKGRPKQAKPNPVEAINNILFEPVVVKNGDKTQKLLPQEIELQRLTKNALQDKDLKALEHLLKKFDKYRLIPQPEIPECGGIILIPDNDAISVEMAAVLMRFFGAPPWSPEQVAGIYPDYETTRRIADFREQEMLRVRMREILKDN
jgi:hypothetical protein